MVPFRRSVPDWRLYRVNYRVASAVTNTSNCTSSDSTCVQSACYGWRSSYYYRLSDRLVSRYQPIPSHFIAAARFSRADEHECDAADDCSCRSRRIPDDTKRVANQLSSRTSSRRRTAAPRAAVRRRNYAYTVAPKSEWTLAAARLTSRGVVRLIST